MYSSEARPPITPLAVWADQVDHIEVENNTFVKAYLRKRMRVQSFVHADPSFSLHALFVCLCYLF